MAKLDMHIPQNCEDVSMFCTFVLRIDREYGNMAKFGMLYPDRICLNLAFIRPRIDMI